MTTNQKTGALLKGIRKSLGLKQGEFAALLEVDQAYLSRIENNKVEPSLRLIKFAQSLRDNLNKDQKIRSGGDDDRSSSVKEPPAGYNSSLEAERTEVLVLVNQLFERLKELKAKEGRSGQASRIEDVLLAFKPLLEMEDEDPDIPPYIRTVLKNHIPPDILEKLDLK